MIAGTGGAGTLAVHSSLGKLYWFDGALNVQRANLDGSDVETIVPNAGVMSLAFYEVAGKMYMARGLNGILRANVDGTNIETAIPDMFNRNFQGLALDLIEQKMYFSDVLGSERLQRANLDGSKIETLIAGTRIDPSALFGIAVDPIPEPSALLLCAFALVFVCLICRF